MPIPMRKATQCVILAAGLGTRLHPHTLTLPKPMLPVGGRPILERKIDDLPDDIEEVVLVVGYLKESIIGHFGAEWHGRRIRYVVQREMRGSGDALRICRDVLTDRFLVLNGDDLYDSDDMRRALTHDLAILAMPSAHPGVYGSFRTDAEGHLIDIVEGAEARTNTLINTGLYVLDRRFFDYPLVPIRDGREFGLPQTLVRMATDHPIAIPLATFWMPIGNPEELRAADAAVRRRERIIR